MNRIFKVALGAGLLASAGCSEWLSGPEIDADPNNPTVASRDNLLSAVQASQWLFQTGDVARTTSMWLQQMAGTGQQYFFQGGQYQQTENTWGYEWQAVYAGGGLVDLRTIQEVSRELEDSTYLGIAQVWEAYTIGTAADLWGDIPYREAVSDIATPALDPQMQVYGDVQTLLDDAIVNLSGTGQGPGTIDLAYGGDPEPWTELAHTLKARFYLHTAEVNGAPDYQNAIDEALLGISDPDHDFLAVHSGAQGEANVWWQFITQSRPGYINAGAYLVNLLQTRGDPRLTEYFEAGPSAGGAIVGGRPGVDQASGNLAQINSATRLQASYSQPLVTWAENELILAEAYYRTNNESAALTHLNNVKSYFNVPTVSLAGAALFQEIMIEKYIVLFQNIEAWNDYRRTCLPVLTPAPGKAALPRRLYHDVNEVNTNPNVPTVAEQDATDPSGNPAGRNPNDPNPC